MRVAIIGCGAIGKKRGCQPDGHEVVGLFDVNRERAERLGKELQAPCFDNEEELLEKSRADVVIVATVNSSLAASALAAVRTKKHVLVEKPGGVKLSELEELKGCAETNHVAVKVGFNHRFHHAMRQVTDAYRANGFRNLPCSA